MKPSALCTKQAMTVIFIRQSPDISRFRNNEIGRVGASAQAELVSL